MGAKGRSERSFAYVSSVPLDKQDLLLLGAVQANARISMSNLAKAVKMSRPAVADRLRRLEREGVIKTWRAELNPVSLGLSLACYIRIRPLQGHLATIAHLARETQEIVECHRITGEDCFLLKAHVPSVEALEKLIDKFVPYGQTTTSIVQSSPVPLRAPPLPRHN